MALADTARLIASLELQDKFSATASKFDRTVGQMDRRTQTLERIGTHIGNGIRNTAQNIGRLAIIGGGVIASQVVAGVRSLAELEEAQGQTAARIEATGGAANVTAEEVRALSEEIENLSTVDDKAIQAGGNMLLTFRNIRNEVGDGNDIFDQATRAVVDLSVAMGSKPEDAALQLGKALNDPIRGLTALRRVGVQFTEAQEKQIKKMVEAGDTMGAQKIILRELNQEFGGSAEAFGKSGPGATMRRFTDAVEDGQQALARGFLPLMERVSEMAQEAFSDPKVIAGIESFGEGLAGGLDQLIDIASKLPWGAIGDSLKIAGTGAKAVLDAFTSLPPWIQTAVLTGWGLNKLTGGALGGLVGTLTKGLLPGGGLRGATPATPLFTKEVGLGGAVGGGAPVAAGGARGVLGRAGGFLGTVGILAADAFLIAEAVGEFQRQDANVEVAQDFVQKVVDDRSRNATVAELKQLSTDLQTEIDREMGDPLSGLLKWSLVNSDLERQQQAVEAEIAAGTKQQTYNAQLSREAIRTGLYETRNEFRIGRLDMAARLNTVATRTAESRAATDRGFSATNAQLGSQGATLRGILAKPSSFTANLQNTINVNLNASLIEERILQQRLSAGTGFGPGLP